MLPVLRTLTLTGLAAAAAFALVAAPAAAQSDDEPLARFQDALCPGVVGLRVDAAEQVVGRIRANAHTLGLRLAEENSACKPNVVVAILADGAAFIDKIEADNGWMFAEMDRDEAAALRADPGPARALLRTRTRTRDGLPVARRESLDDLPQATMWMAHSKIYSATRNDILSAMVLLDRAAVRGLTLTQIADYATFRALAHTLPQNVAVRPDSILALFEGGSDKPAELTEFDRAYLGGLYQGLPNLPGPARMSYLEEVTGRNLFLE
jgi:hypothetical protein